MRNLTYLWNVEGREEERERGKGERWGVRAKLLIKSGIHDVVDMR